MMDSLLSCRQLGNEAGQFPSVLRTLESPDPLAHVQGLKGSASHSETRNFADVCWDRVQLYSYGCSDWVPQLSDPNTAKFQLNLTLALGHPPKPHQGLSSTRSW